MSGMPPSLPESEIRGIEVRYLAALDELSPALGRDARALLARIVAPNWALEWTLPYWLCEAFALPLHVGRSLVLANVLMLGYGRLADDLVDGDEDAGATRLFVALHHLWIAQYIRLGVPMEFWRSFDEYVTQFIRGTLASYERSEGVAEENPLRLVAWRGAPLKTCCAAACLLASRERDLPRLAAAIDELMSGVVLLDDEFDWEEDLTAGRYNGFVAFCSPLPQREEYRLANRLAVLRVIYNGEAAARPYFEGIRARLGVTGETARAIGCKGLGEFVAWYGAEVAACGTYLAREAKRELRALVKAARRGVGR